MSAAHAEDRLPPDKSDVVVLSGRGGNDAINGLMRCVSALLEQNGHATHFFDLSRTSPEDVSRLARLVLGGSVAFAVSFLGIGQDIAIPAGDSKQPVNLWDCTGVPVIKLHGDTPAYFLQRHADEPRNAVNTYYFDEHLAFRRWMLPDAASMGTTVDPFIISDTPLAAIDFAARERGTLVFLKNGGDPRELMALWPQKLPETISDQLIELALDVVKPALKSGRFAIHEFVIERLSASRLDVRQMRRIVRLYTAQLDDYVRRVKATMVAQALLRFPVVIQGAGWQHLDLSGARARVASPLDFTATEAVFQTALGVIDLTPNADGMGHDRLWRAAGAYAFGLTNRIGWLETLAPELHARAYEFDPESIAHSVEACLARPSECIALAQSYGKAFRRRYDMREWADRLAALAEASALEHAAAPPQLQPYFVW